VSIASFSSVVAIGCGPSASHSLAVKSNGTAWAWGKNC
jgi:alpha-tubulin suppressor-like RCC1 family protein